MDAKTIGVAAAVLALLVLGYVAFTRSREAPAAAPPPRSATPKAPPENPYRALREQALRVTAEEAGLKVGMDEPFMILMEMNVSDEIATLVTLHDGTTSLYLSTGGGVIGGGTHAAVEKAGKAYLASAKDDLKHMEKTTDFPTPPPGRIRFYVRTPADTFTAEESEDRLVKGQGPLAGLFSESQKVMTELRLAQQKMKE